MGVALTAVSGTFMTIFEFFHISTVSAVHMGIFLILSFSGIYAAAKKAKKAKRIFYAGTD